MAKSKDKWQFGDFQTPLILAEQVCKRLKTYGICPKSILEPTCGVGSFLEAAESIFPQHERLIGFDVNDDYLTMARDRLRGGSAEIERRDFFRTDWAQVLEGLPEPILIIGNPPWVTSAELGALQSTNLPEKSNFQGHTGLDAITGKANFDISEWMLLKHFEWLWNKRAFIAVLCKTAVARKVLRQMWLKNAPIAHAEIVNIDAGAHFGAYVDACLFFVEMRPGAAAVDADIFKSLSDLDADHTIGIHDGVLVADVDTYLATRELRGKDPYYVWRSGLKHDCSRVMELTLSDGALINGLGEKVQIEPQFLYPLVKSSDVGNGVLRAPRKMVIVTQKTIGEDTNKIKHEAPKTWNYLQKHADFLGKRGSTIYRGKPIFSIFGVGAYTFAPYKVAISGFYKRLDFKILEPCNGKPIVPDDTIYFLPARSKEEAKFLCSVLNAERPKAFLNSQAFWLEKRPITVDLLKRLSIQTAARVEGQEAAYKSFTELAGNCRNNAEGELPLHVA